MFSISSLSLRNHCYTMIAQVDIMVAAADQGSLLHQACDPQGTQISDVPLYLLWPHISNLTRHEYLSLFQTSKAFRDLVLTSSPHAQCTISLDLHGQPCIPAGPASAAWAVGMRSTTVLRLCLHQQQGKENNSTGLENQDVSGTGAQVTVAAAIASTVQPAMGQVLTSLVLQGLWLDAVVPASVTKCFPVLQRLVLECCGLVTAAEAPRSSACAHSQLQHISIMHTFLRLSPGSNQCLPMLARLPKLSSLSVSWPYVQLQLIPAAAAAQITSLTVLHSGAKSVNTDLATAAKRFTALQSLHLQLARSATDVKLASLPCTATLQILCTTITQLRSLHVPFAIVQDPNTLLTLPHLTRLHVHKVLFPQSGNSRQSYADAACRWQQLHIGHAEPADVARLPLHSLTAPLQINALWLDWQDLRSSPVAELQAAAANLAKAPQGMLPPSVVIMQLHEHYNSKRLLAECTAAKPLLQGFQGQLSVRAHWFHNSVEASLFDAFACAGMLLSKLHALHFRCTPAWGAFWDMAAIHLQGLQRLVIGSLGPGAAEPLMRFLLSSRHCIELDIKEVPPGDRKHVAELLQASGATHVHLRYSKF